MIHWRIALLGIYQIVKFPYQERTITIDGSFIKISDNTYEVDLKKGSSGLGFSVQGGSDINKTDPYGDVVRIKKLFPLGPALASGQIQAGDVVLEVNGKPVKGLTQAV